MEPFSCSNCGGSLQFNPGELALKCPYCGTLNKIPEATPPEIFEELDFDSALANFENASDTIEVKIVKCPACSGENTFEANTTTGNCIFCGTNLVADNEPHKAMKPQYLLPFRLAKDKAKQIFINWIKSRRFAPGALKKFARISQPLKGVYFPYWTYDSQTATNYSGKRGIDYQEEVETTDAEGKTVTKTVTKTRWISVSGDVSRFFDDILVPASSTLKDKLLQKLDEWDLHNMLNYSEEYLAGFASESYSVGLEEGFEKAKTFMTSQIEADIRRDIGGDRQRINRRSTKYSGTTFKYLLLPIWTLMYKFKDKYFQVLINASTGEIEGERPVSWIKIALLIFAILGIIGGGIALYLIFGNGG